MRIALLGLAFLSSLACGDYVHAQPDPVLNDTEVGPWRLEAEDYLWYTTAGIWDEPGASGGRVARRPGYSYMLLDDLPFPRTHRPVTIYLRVLPAGRDDRYTLLTTRNKDTDDDVKRTRATLSPTQAGEWTWMQFAPLRAADIGDSFALQFIQSGSTGIGCDSIVISTHADLTPEVLSVAPLLVTTGPRVMASCIDTPPTVDGLGDDPCWRDTVACTDYLTVGALTRAEAETTVRLCYDNQALYLLFSCQEPLLGITGQRRGEFISASTSRDGEIYTDDCIAVLLDPGNTGRACYEVVANALGTIADARCSGPDLWESRDVTWNSQAMAAGSTGDGVWTVELMVPFADLNVSPKLGDTWLVALGRLAQTRKETSSWNPSARGIHDPKPMGTVVFGGTTPGVMLHSPRSLQHGRNSLHVLLAAHENPPDGVYLVTDMTSPQAKTHQRQYAFVGNPGETAVEFEINTEDSTALQFSVLDAATLTPWYCSPMLTRTPKTSSAEVRLACDGPYELYLNDELLARGMSASGESITALLQTGVNVFALYLERGTAAVAVAAPGSRFTAETWKMATAEPTEATSAALDDGPWPLAKRYEEHAELGPVVGEPGQATVLRRTLLWEKTRLWPTPEPALYLARGVPQHFTVIIDGLPGKPLQDWTTYLAVPLDFEIIGSTGFYGTTSPGQPKFICTQLGTQQVAGREMRVAKVTADKPVRAGQHYIMSLFQAFVRYREEAGEPAASETEFIYWSEANAGNVTEPPQSFQVGLLPPLDGRQPRELVFQLWGGWLGNMDDSSLREAVLQCARAAGFNNIVDADRRVRDTSREYGLALTLSTNFRPWEMNLAPYLKEHPDQRLIKLDGQPADDLMCMTRLLNEGWPAVEKELQRRLEEVLPGTVDIDYEYSPYDGPHSCYCSFCLEAFRQFAGLATDIELSPATFKQLLGPQWIDFMAHRVARMCVRFREAVHRLAPGTKFSVYSGYQVPDNPEVYGINWQYIGDLHATDLAGAGYGEPEPDIARTVAALRGIPLLCGLLVVPYDTSATAPLTPLTRAGVLRMLLASTGGILVYDRTNFDGRVWQAVADVSRLAATHEEVFLKGKPATALSGFDITQVQVLQADGVTLICALNLSGQPVEYALALPAETGAGDEFYTGKQVAAGDQFTCRLEPGDVAVYVLQR